MRRAVLSARSIVETTHPPPTPEVERSVDALAESFAKYRVTVIGLIFSKPSEGNGFHSGRRADERGYAHLRSRG
jgi:hypothetical protein